jgi:hypothetical protein
LYRLDLQISKIEWADIHKVVSIAQPSFQHLQWQEFEAAQSFVNLSLKFSLTLLSLQYHIIRHSSALFSGVCIFFVLLKCKNLAQRFSLKKFLSN